MIDIDAIVEQHDSKYINGTTRRDHDDEELGCSEINPLTHWDEVLEASSMTQEDYDRQSDAIVQMQREYWRDLQTYRQTGEWPL